ncbi:MAG: indole-3-glycerol phosphate synthase TrpC [Nitrospirota bacterium]
MTILEKIVAKKKERLSSSKYRTSLSELKSLIRDVESPRDFKKALKRDSGNLKLIAEIKKASPSKGIIRNNFNHIEIASIYEHKNVDAISVITEEDFFQGKLDFLRDVKKITSRPVLRKDFIFDEYQIYEAKANMADAILLIAAILVPNQANEYLHLSQELGISVLFEIHNFEELGIALDVKAPIIGINNRNLKTLHIDLNTSIECKRQIHGDRIVVSESGIKTKNDVLMLANAGLDAMLIGTSFMESQDIGKKIDELRFI